MTIKICFTRKATEAQESPASSPIQQAIKPIWSVVSTCLALGGEQPPRYVRKEEGHRQQLVEEHSQLNQGQSHILQAILASPVLVSQSFSHCISILGQVLADRIIGGSPLERLPSCVGIEVMHQYLQTQEGAEYMALKSAIEQLNHTSQEILTLYQDVLSSKERETQGLMTYECAQKFAQTVYDLQEGQSFLLVGEGSTKNGLKSTIIYEFRKTQNHHYDLFTYAMSRDEDNYRTIFYEDDREWMRPFMHYQNIPASLLFFKDEAASIHADFFQAILEIKILELSTTRGYGIHHLLKHLQPYRVQADQEVSGFLSTARSHNDVWHSVKGIALHYLGKERYKQLAIHIRFLFLVEGYNFGNKELQEDTLEGAQLRTVLKTGANNLLRQLVIYKRNQWICPAEALKYKATALDLIDQIDRYEVEIAQSNLQKRVQFSYRDRNTTEQRIELLGNLQKRVAQATVQPLSIQSAAPTNPTLERGDQFVTQTKELLQALESNQNPAIVRAAIEHFVKQFSIPKTHWSDSEYWSTIPFNQLDSALDVLHTLLTKYDLILGTEGANPTPLSANTVFSIYAVSHFLARRERG